MVGKPTPQVLELSSRYQASLILCPSEFVSCISSHVDLLFLYDRLTPLTRARKFWLHQSLVHFIIMLLYKKIGWYAKLKSNCRPLLYASSPVLYSTLGDRTIVRGLSGVPSKGPVLLVGYHMLMGFEVFTLLEEFIREKNIMLSGLALPALFNGTFESPTSEFLHRIDRGFLELSPSRHVTSSNYSPWNLSCCALSWWYTWGFP